MLGETLMPAAMLSGLSGLHHDEVRAAEPAPACSMRLSPQEGRILRNLVEGHPNKIIARKLGTAETTVKVHMKSILRKIGVKNRTQAAMWAMCHDLVMPPLDSTTQETPKDDSKLDAAKASPEDATRRQPPG